LDGVLNIYFNEPYLIPTFAEIKEIDRYVGLYASKDMPLKITIIKKMGDLYAQATGQAAFPLSSENAPYTFEFKPANIVMEFRLDKKQFILKQGGREFVFLKEEL
jgi:D-alanyl-D-alanine carboxypeptidase